MNKYMVVLVDDSCMYMVNDEVLVHASDEGSEEYEHMFSQFARMENTKVVYEDDVMTTADFNTRFNITSN